MSISNFAESFQTLHGGRQAFPWQLAMHERFTRGEFPATCCIPTGLGKTSVIQIWLLALASFPQLVPRRLIYVVNRRTVVDQATDEASELREHLNLVPWLHKALTGLCATYSDPPLAISTLRGQFADNGEWRRDPTRPAVIVGTVDMIGSRLLFSAYNAGFKAKPMHAGFLGQDALLVHDEAHLEPAFQKLLNSIVKEQSRSDQFGRLRVMELSATLRTEGDVFQLGSKDRANSIVKKRIHATKQLSLHKVASDKQVSDRIAELALSFKDAHRAVVLFTRTVENVEKLAERLRKSGRSVRMLTGTMRGFERDHLVKEAVFARFTPGSISEEETVYLVCTSAGEVGVNISGDHLICDLSTFESMAQRFGRVNRFGDREDTQIQVVHPDEFDESKEYELRRKRTLQLLIQLNGNANPSALEELDPAARREAFSPEPQILPATDILFDAWAMTTIRGKLPGRPPVEPYLHGLADDYNPPATRVAWREEVGVLSTAALLELYQPADLLEDYPLKPHELLQDRSDRVFKHLCSIALRHPLAKVWLLDDTGFVEAVDLGDLADGDSEQIQYSTVILDPKCGGLAAGMLNGDASDEVRDVADDWENRRKRIWDSIDEARSSIPGMRIVRTIDVDVDSDDFDAGDNEVKPKRLWRWFVASQSADDDASKSSAGTVSLEVHTQDVVTHATALANKLPLPDEVRQSLLVAARLHDVGKSRAIFQRVLGNLNSTLPHWAKSGGRTHEFTDYRHEFGSLVEAQRDDELRALNVDMQDLVLHLIAAHHGRGRPHFPLDEVFDSHAPTEILEQIAAEVPQRFARLQRQYGRWGLAYLESILRAADYEASMHPSEFLDVP